jgi:hypothetical protein
MKIKKALRTITLDEVTEMFIESMTDHDTGWGWIHEQASNGSRTETIISIPAWNTRDTKFKVTIEEIK